MFSCGKKNPAGTPMWYSPWLVHGHAMAMAMPMAHPRVGFPPYSNNRFIGVRGRPGRFEYFGPVWCKKKGKIVMPSWSAFSRFLTLRTLQSGASWCHLWHLFEKLGVIDFSNPSRAKTIFCHFGHLHCCQIRTAVFQLGVGRLWNRYF